MTNDPGSPVVEHDLGTRSGPVIAITPALPPIALDGARPFTAGRLDSPLVLPPRPGSGARDARIPVVCVSCDLITHVTSGEVDHDPACEHCAAPLFQRRAFDLEEASFDLHVQAGGVPVAAVFWAPWCKPCDAVLKLVDHAARLLEPRLRFARVNTDNERGLIMRLGIRGIPTLLLFRHGKETARRIGTVDFHVIRGWAAA